MILDEFYGGYNYSTGCDGSTISGAENVVDVNEDGMSFPLFRMNVRFAVDIADCIRQMCS